VSATILFESEIAVPVRLEFRADHDDGIELLSLAPLAAFLAEVEQIAPGALAGGDRRALLKEASEAAAHYAEESALERRLSARGGFE
jgi:hypothetical protein